MSEADQRRWTWWKFWRLLPEAQRQAMRQISLCRLLVINLVTFAVLPSLAVMVLSFVQGYASINTLTQRMLDDAAVRIKNDTGASGSAQRCHQSADIAK